MILGIIKEGKYPPDKRVPLTPQQCVEVQEKFKCKVLVEPSNIRAYSDKEYSDKGIELSENMESCDVLLGVKEVPINDLISGKKYFFFSHTYKEQPYNRTLLQVILQKKIQLIDYEMLTNTRGARVVAFGRYAGIVGAYNGLRGWGERSGSFNLKAAHLCHDRKEMNAELNKLDLPQGFKIVLTGKGRVAGGAIETLNAAGIKQVSPEELLHQTFEEPVFADLAVTDYNKKKSGESFSKNDFYSHPELFESNFMRFAEVSDLYIACHYWDNQAPFIFSREDAKSENFKLRYVADVSCDIDGPVASTLRPSTIADPFYGYDPVNEKVVDHSQPNSIGVMAVDNLPCELPRDASVDFGNDLIKSVIPHLFNEDPDEVIWRGTETKNGKLTPHFDYLQDYVNGNS
ncbi:MAG: NAD(P)-dependent oxidoreductase [Schleiferiaceae bacterium]|nr:NAD(P)-dependent oxidoreductase [Schleiferiaceae bacterium]